MNTGSTQFGRPSMGAWVTYGLGSESQNLPAFVVLSSAGGTSGGAANWGCGFLPTIYQGVPFRRTGDPILFLSNPPGVTASMQRKSLDALKKLDEYFASKSTEAGTEPYALLSKAMTEGAADAKAAHAEVIKRLKELHEETGVPWDYRPLVRFLEERL